MGPVAMVMLQQLGGGSFNRSNAYLIASSSTVVLLVHLGASSSIMVLLVCTMCEPEASVSFISYWLAINPQSTLSLAGSYDPSVVMTTDNKYETVSVPLPH